MNYELIMRFIKKLSQEIFLPELRRFSSTRAASEDNIRLFVVDDGND